MKELEIKSTLQVYDSFEELPEDVRQLMRRSFDIRDKAYAPYSHFLVGAAILLENGEVVLEQAHVNGIALETMLQDEEVHPDVVVHSVEAFHLVLGDDLLFGDLVASLHLMNKLAVVVLDVALLEDDRRDFVL